MDFLEAVAAFENADGELPVAAMEWALANWDEQSPALLALLAHVKRPGAQPKDFRAAFFIAMLAAEKADARAFAPICAIGMDAEVNDEIFGEATTECFASLLVSTFGDDIGPLMTLIESPDGDDWARSQAFMALAYLTKTGRVGLADTEAYLHGAFEMLSAGVDGAVSYGWQEAIAALGLESLAPLVREACERDVVDVAFVDYDEFQEALAETLSSQDGMIGFEVHGIAPIDDAIGYLSDWYGFSAEYREAKARGEFDEVDDADHFGDFDDGPSEIAEPAVNPFRDVGRNDPCPCGSGKKFKKCCLVTA